MNDTDNLIYDSIAKDEKPNKTIVTLQTAAFMVIDQSGHTYAIYADGNIEGFGKDVAVLNGIPNLVHAAIISATRTAHERVPKMYDIHADEFRDVTQADVDRFQRVITAFGALRQGVKELLDQTLAKAQGKEGKSNG